MVGDETDEQPTALSNPDRRAFLRTAVGAGIASGLGVGSAETVTADTDAFVWTYHSGGTWSPQLVDGTFYFHEGPGRLHAVDAASGEQQWFFLPEEGTISSIDVVDGTVYATTTATELYVLDAASGEEQWHFDYDRDEYYNGWGGAEVEDGTIYMGSTSGDLFALDTASRDLQWHTEIDTHLLLPEIVDGSTAYFGSREAMYAIDVASGEERWRIENGPVQIEAMVDGTIYAMGGGVLYAMDADSWEERWRFDAGETYTNDSAATIADGTVYVGSKYLYAVDAASGEQQWRFETEDRGWGGAAPGHKSLTVGDGTVYIGDVNALVAVDAASGEQEWRFETRWEVDWLPAVEDGIVYVGESILYAVDIASVVDNLIYAGEEGHVYATEDAWDLKEAYGLTEGGTNSFAILSLLSIGGGGVFWLANRLEETASREDREGQPYDSKLRRK